MIDSNSSDATPVSGDAGADGGSGRTQPLVSAPDIGRSVKEWVGRSNDSQIPPRVRIRVFERDGGKCQCGCGHIIRAGEQWQTDHIVALINGGANRESNLQTLYGPCHKLKTKADTAEKSATYKSKLKHLGLKKPKHPMLGGRNSNLKKRMDGTVVDRATGEPVRWR